MDSIVLEKRCAKCGEIKSLLEFHKQSKTKDGYSAWCKSCKHLFRAEHYKNNKSKQNNNANFWKKSHRDKINLKNKENYWLDVEFSRALYREYSKKYRNNHPNKVTENNNRYRAKRSQSGGVITSSEWERLCNFYGNVCLSCGRNNVKLTLDHIVPISRGGQNIIDNVQPLCQSCNSRKGAKIIDYRRNNMKSIHVTTDIYLAAAMLSLGARLDGVDKSDPRHMEFTIIAKETKFESSNLPTPEPMDLESIEKQWVNGTLMINAVSFKDAIQRMKSVIHSK